VSNIKCADYEKYKKICDLLTESKKVYKLMQKNGLLDVPFTCKEIKEKGIKKDE